MYQSKKPYLYGTGRRKSSVARVHLFENGTGSITINGRDIDEYFGLETLKMVVRQPLAATETLGKVDIVATVEGGGVSGQAGALRHGVACEHLDYIQIHPTTLYSHRKGRRFLISESVRGEGALLLDKNGNRFTNELQPRDVVSAAIRAQMEKDGTDHVWEDMRPIGEAAIREHFPNILERCEEEGYDPIHEPIPVVPAQHYFMGGITADLSSRTALPRLYACGETCCNGVHGRNRLASNSLLESLVFAQRAADDILYGEPPVFTGDKPDLAPYREQEPLFAAYRQEVLTAIERSKNHE